jgi:hypothetical protein
MHTTVFLQTNCKILACVLRRVRLYPTQRTHLLTVDRDDAPITVHMFVPERRKVRCHQHLLLSMVIYDQIKVRALQ